MTPRAHTVLWSVVRHLLLLCGAAFILLPFVWMISTASKPQTEIFTTDLHFIPYSFALWDNLSTAFAKANLWRFLLNGVVATVAIFALQVLVALPAAYALAKLRFAGREVLFALVLFCILIPPQATAIPVFLLFHKLGILDSYAAHYNAHRPHRSLGQRPPEPRTGVADVAATGVRRRPILGGLINEYAQAA